MTPRRPTLAGCTLCGSLSLAGVDCSRCSRRVLLTLEPRREPLAARAALGFAVVLALFVLASVLDAPEPAHERREAVLR